jgi:DNA-binding winged helix-turn-helix (wHTH) protein
MSRILIDNRMVFDEDNFLLCLLDDPAVEPCRLNAISSRCLAQLLRSKGAVVRKRELIAGAWGEYGFEVTDNSLAQVVRQLRVVIDRFQPGLELIQTHPRIGYGLVEGVQIVELQAAPLAVEEDFPAPQSAEPLLDMPMPTAEPAPVAAPLVSRRSWRSTAPILGLLVLCSVLVFQLGAAWSGQPLTPRPFDFVPPTLIDGAWVHLPVGVSIPPERLQRVLHTGKQVADWTGMADASGHLYLLPDYLGRHFLLCAGEMRVASSQCIGVNLRD